MITFAVVGRNEAPTLPRAIKTAQDAAEPDDDVIFVDSASEDNSLGIADVMGIRTVRAPVGKGRAMARALTATSTPYICFLDADIYGSSGNIAAALGESVRRWAPDMAVGEFEDDDSLPSVTRGVYTSLVSALFPEAASKYGKKPLTGFRVLRTDSAIGRLPPDFGVEAHLNISMALGPNTSIRTVDVGSYQGRFLYKPRMGAEVGRTILDLAQAHERLTAHARPHWDTWLKVIVDHIATYRGEPQHRPVYRARLLELAERPTPPRH
jgi:glucosyl-3-phosphoglycerate synthase